ncbi:MAG: hypothetical protein A2284_15015 [Deltaproteobacteria bacterium RIFOXYA12_FULL_61_11]|nr:MAG: hypothetical protein A2284_15015 [Deltaproteobacteria bacterium RIFOXYA12_FULL_61_11]
MSTARYWREIPHRYRLEASRCKQCGYIAYPHRLICPECQCREFVPITLKNTGTIETYTVIRVAPSQFVDQVPYAVAIVKLDDGVALTCQVADTDPSKLAIGKRVTLEFRRIQADGEAGVLAYGLKAVLQP